MPRDDRQKTDALAKMFEGLTEKPLGGQLLAKRLAESFEREVSNADAAKLLREAADALEGKRR